MLIIVAHCKERWRNLRACLTRHLKQQQTANEDGSVNHKPYYLADHMNFLLPYTKSRTIKEQIKYETPATDEDHKPSTSSGKVTKLSGPTTTTYTISTDESDENQYVTLIQSSSANGLEETHVHVDTATDSESKAIALSSEQSYTTTNNMPKEHLQEIIYESMPAKRIKVSQEMDDADLDFFRSLLPDIRLMTASQKRRFKMGIFGLIDNVLSNNDMST